MKPTALPPPFAAAALAAMTTLATVASAAAAPGAAQCVAHSGASVAAVVELYTSEGCNSCPPADRWLSAWATDPGVVALAFHVDYWDGLGWKDRFGSPAHTARQRQQQAVNGARFSYTPQVVVDGADRPDWPGLRTLPARREPAPVSIQLTRDGERFDAAVQVSPGGPARLAAYWAVTEQNHVSSIKAGENRGATLKHDFVVREYRPVPVWTATAGTPATLSFAPSAAAPGEAATAHARHVNLVVVDAATGRPVQALKLGC